ncbi:MAG: hypothetical protein HYS05_05890 [Acidobacteria bacterium]|nr:hypothetical protein [Acidobacteriota bacterium]
MTRHLTRVAFLSLVMLVATPLYLAAQPQSEGPRAGPGGGGPGSGGAGERGGGGGSSGGSSAGSGMSDSGGSSSGGGSMSAPSPTPWAGRDSGIERAPGRFQDGQPAHQGPPPYSRPRGDHPAIGQAIPRSEAPTPPARSSATAPYGYYPYGYNTYGYGYNGYGYGAFGLGYFYYDPMWWSYPSGYWYGYPSSGGYGGYYEQGAVRLKIKPEHADVYVDGYYVGQVDDFDGIFQRLRLDYGPHRVEIRARGFESLVFELRAQPGRTITYRGELKPAP